MVLRYYLSYCLCLIELVVTYSVTIFPHVVDCCLKINCFLLKLNYHPSQSVR